MPPYVLSRLDRVGEVTLWRSDDLDMLLDKRDENRAVEDLARLGFRVTDEDDPERGEAEWCEVCGAHGGFSADEGPMCDLCRQVEDEAVA